MSLFFSGGKLKRGKLRSIHSNRVGLLLGHLSAKLLIRPVMEAEPAESQKENVLAINKILTKLKIYIEYRQMFIKDKNNAHTEIRKIVSQAKSAYSLEEEMEYQDCNMRKGDVPRHLIKFTIARKVEN